jgi:hypothetical protein
MITAERIRKVRSTGQREEGLRWIMAAGLAAMMMSATGGAHAQAAGQTASAVTEQLFDRVNDSVCTISAIATDGSYVSRGSGFVLRDSGLLVTNAHVVAGLENARAKCAGRQLDIRRIVRFDRDVDLAIAEIGSVDVPGLVLATDTNVRPGSQIYVFGSPYGLEGTITPGLASGRRDIDGRSYIQISAPIGAGNSGGPVTDERGNVLGVAVASLEVDQNINFAIPAAAITGLPDVDMQTAELATERAGTNTAPTVEKPSLPVRPAVATGTAAFRGNVFGSPCGDVAVAEYERRRSVVGTGQGDVRFDKWYDGSLEMDVELLGTPATVVYECDEQFGMTAGYYRIRGNSEGLDRIERVLRAKYGSGVVQPISETDAKQRGCRWNSSLPGSRFYRPSEWKSWRVDDRFHIDLLVCGGRSKTTFLYYSDPTLVSSAGAASDDSMPPDRPRYRESDL